MTNEIDRPLKPSEAAEYLGLKKGSLYNLVHAGKITCYKPSGKLIFFRRKDLDAYAFRNQKLADFEVNRTAEDLLNMKLRRYFEREVGETK
jgi:excisionase family DNA binding protein